MKAYIRQVIDPKNDLKDRWLVRSNVDHFHYVDGKVWFFFNDGSYESFNLHEVRSVALECPTAKPVYVTDVEGEPPLEAA